MRCRNSSTCETFTAACDGKTSTLLCGYWRVYITDYTEYLLCAFSDHLIRSMFKQPRDVRPSDGTGEMKFPRFKHINQFSFSASAGSPTQAYEFLSQNRGSLRNVHLHNLNWTFPSEFLSIRNLTSLDFLGTFAADSLGIAEILSNGIQLESLRLQCVLECNASAQFRQYSDSL